MGIKYCWMSSIYPCVKINVCIYPKDFPNKLWGMLHIKQMLYVWGERGEEKKEEKNFAASAAMLKVIVQQLDTLRCSTGSLTCKWQITILMVTLWDYFSSS